MRLVRSVRKLDSGKETCPARATVKFRPRFDHAVDLYVSARMGKLSDAMAPKGGKQLHEDKAAFWYVT